MVTDHLGTPQVLTDQNQAVVWQSNSTPFGEEQNPSPQQSLRFPGQYADAESGYSYNYFRDYDPSLGRYVQSDPIGLKGGINTYAYVAGNPLTRIDPLGLELVDGADLMCTSIAGRAIPGCIAQSGLGGGGAKPAAPKQCPRVNKRGISEFQGLEVRAQRPLSHVDESTLRAMQRYGFSAKDAKGNKLELHHHRQNPEGPIIEIPAKNHSISNRRQHPYGNQSGSGLTQQQREQFDRWREAYWKYRATQELENRGL